MSRRKPRARREARARRPTPSEAAHSPGAAPRESDYPDATSGLPRGRIPTIGVRELVAALHRRRERRRATAAELSRALGNLAAAVENHRQRVSELKEAIEQQGGDLSHLKNYDGLMARLRAELHAAERSLADAFRSAAGGG